MRRVNKCREAKLCWICGFAQMYSTGAENYSSSATFYAIHFLLSGNKSCCFNNSLCGVCRPDQQNKAKYAIFDTLIKTAKFSRKELLLFTKREGPVFEKHYHFHWLLQRLSFLCHFRWHNNQQLFWGFSQRSIKSEDNDGKLISVHQCRGNFPMCCLYEVIVW